MDRKDALRQLPLAYAVALRLHDRGFEHRTLAALLGVEREAVGPLLAVAEAKLASLIAEPDGDRPESRRMGWKGADDA